jgi:hypothetical protein
MTRDQLVARLKKGWRMQISGDDQPEPDSHFDAIHFRFHGPDGFEADYSGLSDYFKAIRSAFDDRSIRRGIIVAEGNDVACQTRIEGTFVREFTQSPAGSLPPNGQRVVWDPTELFSA